MGINLSFAVDGMETSVLIFWSCFVFGFVTFLWELYLSWRQYRKHRDTPELPEDLKEIIDQESYKKSRLYSLDNARFGFAHDTWSAVANSMVLLFNLIFVFWNISGQIMNSWGFNGEIIQSVAFLILCGLIEFVIGLPWIMYHTFIIEEKHGFNKQTMGFFLKDQVKKFVLSMAIGAPVMAALLWIIQIGGDYFFFYVWIFLLCVTFFFMTIYPEFIAPLFDKYTLLKDGDLKTKIEALAARLEFPLKKLYVVEGSKRSAHSNAYFYGFWKNKRIVLYDTLIAGYSCQSDSASSDESQKTESSEAQNTQEESNGDWEKPENGEKISEESKSNLEVKSLTDLELNDDANSQDVLVSASKSTASPTKKDLGMSDDEVVAVLGHELGHWKLNHTMLNLVLMQVNLLLCLLLFNFLYKMPVLYAAFGFTDSQPVFIGLLIIFMFIFAPYNELISFLTTCWSRRCEFGADEFSARLGYSVLLRSALTKLCKDNLSNPVNDRLYSQWHHSHPPVSERFEQLKKFD